MTKVTLYLEPAVALFYSPGRRLGRTAVGAGALRQPLQAGGGIESGGTAKPGGKPIVISSRICYTKRERNPRRFSGAKTRYLEVPP